MKDDLAHLPTNGEAPTPEELARLESQLAAIGEWFLDGMAATRPAVEEQCELCGGEGVVDTEGSYVVCPCQPDWEGEERK